MGTLIAKKTPKQHGHDHRMINTMLPEGIKFS